MKNHTTTTFALMLLCSCDLETEEVPQDGLTSGELDAFEPHYFRIVEGWIPLSDSSYALQPPQLVLEFMEASLEQQSCTVRLQGEVQGTNIQDKLLLYGLRRTDGDCPRSINKLLKPELRFAAQVEPLLESQRTNLRRAFEESGQPWDEYSNHALGGMSALFKQAELPGGEGAWFLGYRLDNGAVHPQPVSRDQAELIRILGLLSYSMDELP